MKKITVYSTTTCPYCVMLSRWLKEKNIDFSEYKVDINPVAAQSMMALSGQRGVPFTTIESDDGTMEKILGYDISRFQVALGV
jgi:glutaredoxin 3